VQFILVSVIVPVFNVEKYLEECINSLLQQTLKEIEIIIINDGSTDASEEIIDKYRKKDHRIVYINSNHEGVSSSRNKGLRAAKGEFIGFVDADDYVDTKMFEILYKNMKHFECELIICNAKMIDANLEYRPRLNLNNKVLDISKNKITELLNFLDFKYDNANWNKLYLNSIIQKENILFNEKMNIWEDILFNLIYLQYINKAVVLKDCLYVYRINPTSIMTNHEIRLGEQYSLLFKTFSSFCKENKMDEQLLVFESECVKGSIPTLVRFIQATHSGFNLRVKRLKSELQQLDRSIYLNKEFKDSMWPIKRFLLQNRFFFVYSFLYLTPITIKGIIRQLFNIK
jgi:glycosyltransferase involved in cell wall biosynthesis